jgi:hypothetical protein
MIRKSFLIILKRKDKTNFSIVHWKYNILKKSKDIFDRYITKNICI